MDQYDVYYDDIVDALSDGDSSSSSEDIEEDDDSKLFTLGKHLTEEDKNVLMSSMNNKRMLRDDGQGQDQNVNEDDVDFEQEMQNEARMHIDGLHFASVPRQDAESSQTAPAGQASEQLPPSLLLPSTSKTREEENDELLYDPDEDDSNQHWVDSLGPDLTAADDTFHTSDQLPGQAKALDQAQRVKLRRDAQRRAARSDATLNCPCCLDLLCTDCQRHQVYKTQYRAMFVVNCRIDFNNKLVHKSREEKRKPFRKGSANPKKNKNRKASSRTSEKDDQDHLEDGWEEVKDGRMDIYYPVHCTGCNTQVAMYDMDEVYHFFAVIASH